MLHRLSLCALAFCLVPSSARAQDDDLEIVVPAAPEEDLEVVARPEVPPAETPSEADEVAALRAELAALRARLDAVEARETVVEPAPEEASPVEEEAPTETEAPAGSDLLSTFAQGLHLSGYIQTQYEWSDLSEDQLLQGGAILNRNRLVIRRGRLRVTGRWDFVETDFELDASTTRGLTVSVRRASIGVAAREHADDLTPLVRLRAGLSEIPFGHELRFSQRDLPFMERTTGSLSFFRGPVDVGARLDGGLGFFRYDLAVVSGTPLDDRAGATSLDPTAAPDVVGRLGVALDLSPEVQLNGGLSFLWGTGFSPGQDATSNHLEWRDLNESGTLDTGEIVAIPGRAAIPSSTFEHWALGADLELTARTALGTTSVFGEFVIAQNLDRAFFIADPIVLRAPVRELSAYLAIAQEVFDWGLLGFRYDWYDPNSDLFEQRRGIAVPGDASIHTLSPMVGARLPEGLVDGFRGRLVFQYDVILDALGRDARGVPTDLKNDQFTLRVQGEF